MNAFYDFKVYAFNSLLGKLVRKHSKRIHYYLYDKELSMEILLEK